jgi:hypothetical protein
MTRGRKRMQRNRTTTELEQAFQQQPHLSHFGAVVEAIERRHVHG